MNRTSSEVLQKNENAEETNLLGKINQETSSATSKDPSSSPPIHSNSTTTTITSSNTTSSPLPTESLFDAFPLPDPDPPTPTSTTSMYDPVAYAQYREVLDVITESHQFQKKHRSRPVPDGVAQEVKEWLRADGPVFADGEEENAVRQLVHERATGTATTEESSTVSPSSIVSEQRRRFCERLGFTNLHYQTATGCLLQVTNHLCRGGLGAALRVVWPKVQEAGLTLDRLLHNLLYVAATFPTSTTSRKAKSAPYAHLTGVVSILDAVLEGLPGDDETATTSTTTTTHDLVDEIAIYHDLLHAPTEQSLHIRVKLLVTQGHAQQAQDLLLESSKSPLRLRSCLPLLRLWLELEQPAAALRFYRECMRESTTVHMDADAYSYLLEGLLRLRVFAEEDLGGTTATTTCGGGSEGLDGLVQDMARDLIAIPEGAAKRLRNGLALGYPELGLEPCSAVAPLPLVVETEEQQSSSFYADRVKIDPTTGLCPKSGIKLRLIHLSDAMKTQLAQRLLSMANDTYEKFQEKVMPTANAPIRRKVLPEDHLESFFNWLNERNGPPFTTIIDGANVGYYQQNFVEGRFSFHQIEAVATALEELGETVLIVLPSKYGKPHFTVSTNAAGSTSERRQQRLNKDERAIQRRLIARGLVYFVPTGYLDDFYWIIASLSPQSKARTQGNSTLEVGPNDPSGRWPGIRPVLITNDQMRDHQVEMLEPLLFRRWFSNNIVNYNFAAFCQGVSPGGNRIGFGPADFFSREIQGNPCDATHSTVWHFPLEDKADEWFCLRIPRQDTSTTTETPTTASTAV